MKTRTFKFEGYEFIERVAGASGNSAYVYLPKRWRGKRVAIIALEQLDDV